MKKIILISILCSSFMFANQCKDLPKEQRQACKENKLNNIKEIESTSHNGRIAILNEADNCIKNATTKEAYKQCETIEKEKRQTLKSNIKEKRQALRQ